MCDTPPKSAVAGCRVLSRAALALLVAFAATACDDELPAAIWSADLVPCDAREAACVARLARGLAHIHGAPWPADIAVEIEEIGRGNPSPPFDWWWTTAPPPTSPFDVLDRAWPSVASPVGSVRLFGDRKLVFRINPRVENDAPLRHRLGLIRSLSAHLRNRVSPGHPIDNYGAFPTRTNLRSGVRTAIALMVEQAIQRAADGEHPWRFDAEQYAKVRDLRAREGGPELVALARLHALHDPDDPWAVLIGVPGAVGHGCLIGFDLDDMSRCVQVAPAVAADEIEGFVARSADAADGILLEEALLADEHPAAAFALDLRAHLGRHYTRDDGAGVRRDTFVFDDTATAAGFARALKQALDDDPLWDADGDRWVFAGDDDRPADGESRVIADGFEVVVVAGTPGVDTTGFLDSAGVRVSPLADPPALEDVACAPDAPLPCDVRQSCCRDRLFAETERLLGPLPQIDLRAVDPETAVQIYVGPQWADDRLSSRVSAEVRFASGIDHRLRGTNDAAETERASRVLAWYYNTLRSVVLVVPTAPIEERNLLRENSTVVHELVHAWQDARYGLSAIRLAARLQLGDAEAALITYVEGHAELVAEAFEAEVQGRAVDDIDWAAWADELVDLIAPALDDAEEPARTNDPWLPYVGGLAAASRAFDAGADLVAVGDRIEAPPVSTGAVLGALYDGTSAPALALPVATPGEFEDGDLPAALDGAVTAHRGVIGPWPLALRLAAEIGGQAAIDAVLGVAGAREVVALHPEGSLTWIDVTAAFGDDALADGLDALGAALSERSARTYRIERDAARITLVVAPTAALVDAIFAAIR